MGSVPQQQGGERHGGSEKSGASGERDEQAPTWLEALQLPDLLGAVLDIEEQ
jgi:hypothetical protein